MLQPQLAPNRGNSARRRFPISTQGLATRLVGLAFVDAVAVWFALTLLNDNLTIAALILAIITVGVNWILLSESLYPLRWLTPGLLLLFLMVVYPLGYTVYSSFTNYSDAHRLTKAQVLTQLEARTYQPKGAATYNLTAYRNPDGKFKVILQNSTTGQPILLADCDLRGGAPGCWQFW